LFQSFQHLHGQIYMNLNGPVCFVVQTSLKSARARNVECSTCEDEPLHYDMESSSVDGISHFRVQSSVGRLVARPPACNDGSSSGSLAHTTWCQTAGSAGNGNRAHLASPPTSLSLGYCPFVRQRRRWYAFGPRSTSWRNFCAEGWSGS
jgi:hypothetical protein